MNLTNEPSNEFEKLFLNMLRASGPLRSTTDQRVPADSGQRKDSASGMKSDWTAAVVLAILLGFMFAMSWLFLTHV
jgi:hypothetical protein